MKIALIHNVKLPVSLYGGTERVVWWLAKGLSELGVSVVLVAGEGSQCPFAEVRSADFSRPIESQFSDIDLFHYNLTPETPPHRPHLVTIGGNGKLGETYLRNTVFVSRNHATRHGAECFVYNGLDPSDYLYRDKKEDYLVFLAKASWRVKNVKGAIRLAKQARKPLHIAGGKRFCLNHWRGIHWDGMLGGTKKAELVASSSGLLFPVLWNEPFGLAVIEAMVSGTPVLASPFGSLPELVTDSVGAICRSRDGFLSAIERLPQWRASDCRDWVMEMFHYLKMARDYRALYERVLDGESLNASIPTAHEAPQQIFPTDF